MIAEKRNEFYVMDIIEDHAMQTSKNPGNLKRWYHRFGYLNYMDLKSLKVNSMVAGLKLDMKNTSEDCMVRICAKDKIQHFCTKALNIGKNKNSGLCTRTFAIQWVQNLGGTKYFVTFIDNLLCYTETVMLRQRSDVLTAFKNLKKRAEKETGV